MNATVDELIRDFEAGNFLSGEEKCLAYIKNCKHEFAEKLTVNTATDYAGSIILFSQFCAGEKKPWKAIPMLQDAAGCFRFLEDFMQDRQMYATTMFSVASSFSYAGFFSEAVSYFRKAVEFATDHEILEEAAYRMVFDALRAGDSVEGGLLPFIREKLGDDHAALIHQRAADEFSSLIITDPVEKEECFMKIRYELEREVDQLVSSSDESVPFCLRYWQCKKQVLKDRYGIDWRSPAECNPEIKFQ